MFEIRKIMTVRETIEYLKTLDQDARIFLQYDSFMWYELSPSFIETIDEDDIDCYDARSLGVKTTDYKIELG